MKMDDHAFISACETDGLLIDEHEVDVDDKSVITRIYKYAGDTYAHMLVNGKTLAFTELIAADHSVK